MDNSTPLPEPHDPLYHGQVAELMKLTFVEDLGAQYEEVRGRMAMALLGMPLDSHALSRMQEEVERAIDLSVFSSAHVGRLRVVRAAVADVCAIRRSGEEGRQPDTVTEDD